MFTGLIEELGTVTGIEKKGTEGAKIRIQANRVMEGLCLGDSVSVNGVCLTVSVLGKETFTADAMPETLRKTTLERLKIGEKANLERAMSAGGRFGGHFVTGHIDGVGRVVKRHREGNSLVFKVAAPAEVLRFTVEKGSIAIDGISLTVALIDKDSLSVSIIPHTAAETTLNQRKVGDLVNLEGDYIGKYIDKLLRERAPDKGIRRDLLKENGFI